MNKENVSVLFMDDEIHDESIVVVNKAVKALKQEKYDITVTDKMSDAVDGFYNKFYKVFILDIDMQKVKDISYEGKRGGTQIASIYIGLDNGCKIIMYSAAGTVEDWFDLANRHIYGYVFKNDDNAIEKLLKMVEKASEEENFINLPEPKKSGEILITQLEPKVFQDNDIKEIIKNAGDFIPVFCENFNEMPEKLKSNNYAGALIIADEFSTHPEDTDLDLIYNITELQPLPNVVIACDGKNGNMESIIEIVNARPFRFINLQKPDAKEKLAKAVKDAAWWYAGNEVFVVDKKYVQRAAKNIDWEELRKRFEFDDNAEFEEDKQTSSEEDSGEKHD